MMNRLLKLLLAALLLPLFGGCSAEENFSDEGSGECVVHFALAGIAANTLDAGTRAVTPENLKPGATVRVLAYRRAGTSAAIGLDTYAGEATYVADAWGNLTACVTDALGVLTTGTAADLTLKEGTYDFYAVTPALAVDRSLAGAVASVTHGVDYATCLTESVTVRKPADLGAARQEVTLSTLERRCAKFSFEVTRKFGNVTKVEIQQVQLTKMADSPLQGVPGQDLAVAAANATTLTMPSTAFTVGANAWQASGSTVVLPKTSEVYTIHVRVRFNDDADATDLSTSVPAMALEKGNQYAFTLMLKGNAVGLLLTVLPWNTTIDWNDDTGTPIGGQLLLAIWQMMDWSNDGVGQPTLSDMTLTEWQSLTWTDEPMGN